MGTEFQNSLLFGVCVSNFERTLILPLSPPQREKREKKSESPVISHTIPIPLDLVSIDRSRTWALGSFSTSNLSNSSSPVSFHFPFSSSSSSSIVGFPSHLSHFPFLCSFVLLVELKKQISCSLQLSNKTDSYVAFKVILINFGFLIPSFLPSVFFFSFN